MVFRTRLGALRQHRSLRETLRDFSARTLRQSPPRTRRYTSWKIGKSVAAQPRLVSLTPHAQSAQCHCLCASTEIPTTENVRKICNYGTRIIFEHQMMSKKPSRISKQGPVRTARSAGRIHGGSPTVHCATPSAWTTTASLDNNCGVPSRCLPARALENFDQHRNPKGTDATTSVHPHKSPSQKKFLKTEFHILVPRIWKKLQYWRGRGSGGAVVIGALS